MKIFTENTRSGTLTERRSQLAYTIAEVIIAVLLIGLLFFSLYAGFSSGFSVIKLAREDLRATQILVQRMETIRLYNWSQVRDTSYFPLTFVERYDPLSQSTGGGGTSYRGFITLTNPSTVPAAYRTNMLLVTVTMYWTNSLGTNRVTRRRQMQTFMSRFGMHNYIWNNVYTN